MTHLISTLIKMVVNQIPVVWDPKNNKEYPRFIKNVVKLLLLIRKRKTTLLFNIPKFVLFHIINFYIFMIPEKYGCVWDTSLFAL